MSPDPGWPAERCTPDGATYLVAGRSGGGLRADAIGPRRHYVIRGAASGIITSAWSVTLTAGIIGTRDSGRRSTAISTATASPTRTITVRPWQPLTKRTRTMTALATAATRLADKTATRCGRVRQLSDFTTPAARHGRRRRGRCGRLPGYDSRASVTPMVATGRPSPCVIQASRVC
jgi:hypothetical protein